MTDIIRIKSVSEIHQIFGFEKPLHPHITIIKEWPQIDVGWGNKKVVSDLYVLGLKGNVNRTIKYGRKEYDYEEGTLVFMAPNQVAQFDTSDTEIDTEIDEWNIFFHPDLFRKTTLGTKIESYSYFNYEQNEALHLSEEEKQMLTNFVHGIENELQAETDGHSQDLIITNLESILKYCARYYDRQFHTRAEQNKDFVALFEKYLKDYFASEDLVNRGIPTVTDCGTALNRSGSYLSDLLRAETGKSAKSHIHAYIIDKAKTALLNTDASVSEVAFSLGFEYPQHFSKLFKSKTGMSPKEYVKSN